MLLKVVLITTEAKSDTFKIVIFSGIITGAVILLVPDVKVEAAAAGVMLHPSVETRLQSAHG